MKKKYNAPGVKVVGLRTTKLLANSDDIRSDVGLRYGGVDTSGDLTPETRQHSGLWNDDWDWK